MQNNQTQSQFDEIADRFAVEIRNGNSPQIESYANEHPDLATKILRLFPVLEMMERQGTPLHNISESNLDAAETKFQQTLSLKNLGDYRIVREIGRGGMGIVFEAQQESLGRRVALKLLPDSAQFDARRQQRFQAEARTSGMLHHTNIVPVFGVGEHEGTSYFVMQYIHGQPLNSVLAELSRIRSNSAPSVTEITKPIGCASTNTLANEIITHDFSSATSTSKLSPQSTHETPAADSSQSSLSATTISNQNAYWNNVARIGIQISNALQHAHSKKILHRDIKPSNLLIDNDGVAWVTDFGLSKFFESPDLTKTGEVIGTLRYMSPEQLNGRADERSDIFALGLTLYEMATLQPAYDAPDRSRLMQQVIEANPKSIRSVDRNVPRDLETIIHKCIALEPSARYQQPARIAEDLQRFLDGEPVLARRISALERVTKWCRRRPAVSSLLLALALSLVAGFLGIAWQWQKTVDALNMANTNLQQANDQKTLAQEQTVLAQEHFQQARNSVDRFFVVVSNKRLLREHRLLGLRKELLTEALKYHQQFVKRYRDNDELKMELGQSLFFIARIEAQTTRSPENVKRFDESTRIFQELKETNPDDPLPQLWLARSIQHQSEALAGFDVKAALTTILEAIRLFEQFGIDFPESRAELIDLGDAYEIAGLIYERMGKANRQTDLAMKHYQNALLVRIESAALEPDESSNKIKLAKSHRDLGVTYRRAGNPGKAIEHYNQSIEILNEELKLAPRSLEGMEAMASVCNTVGFFYGTQGANRDFEKAIHYFTRSKNQYQSLVRETPMIISFQDGLARAAINLGGVYQVMDDLDAALAERIFAEEIRRKLSENNSDAFHLRSGWASALNAVGSSLRDLGRFDEALSKHEEAHRNHCAVVDAVPDQTFPRLQLINGIKQTSMAHSDAGNFRSALDSLKTIEDFTLKNQSEPVYQMAVEMMVLACEIGKKQVPNPDSNTARSNQKLIDETISASKNAFTEAAQRGSRVLQWVESDPNFDDYAEHRECKALLNWLRSSFGPK